MHFVETFADCFSYSVEFLLLWPQVKGLKNLTIFNRDCLNSDLTRKRFLCNEAMEFMLLLKNV